MCGSSQSKQKHLLDGQFVHVSNQDISDIFKNAKIHKTNLEKNDEVSPQIRSKYTISFLNESWLFSLKNVQANKDVKIKNKKSSNGFESIEIYSVLDETFFLKKSDEVYTPRFDTGKIGFSAGRDEFSEDTHINQTDVLQHNEIYLSGEKDQSDLLHFDKQETIFSQEEKSKKRPVAK